MADQNVTPVERIARQICKLLSSGTGATVQELRARAVSRAPEPHLVSAKWRHRRQPREADFDKAIELAVSSGWLVNREGMISLTPAGSQLGRRSRVGARRVRRAF
jgi:hypothetical protein